MADSTQRLIRELFDGASELPAHQRQAWVEARSGGNPQVISSVMRLLQAANASGQGFLAEPAFKREKPALEEGMMIGPYRVLRELGSGGMGVVYLAMRSDEVYHRMAAVKVIRPELRANPLKDRFLQERDILARLDHPNIARIVDGGTTPNGLPYFVMDYVDGQPLDEFCKLRRATLDERLNLFRQTCDSVQYLHDNKVLHRDLKPANILVTHNGQVKLLDFGVSKLATDAISSNTTGMPIVTAGYASPEQITSKKVTAATDIYSLGVVLYELLTGVRPLKLDGLSLPEVLNTITTQDPPKPSTHPGPPADADPGRLLATIRPRLAGDLDAILLMALRKEPERRYASIREFAQDIANFQNGRSVLARKESSVYRITRTIRRNAWQVAAAAILLVGLGVGGSISYVALQYRNEVKSLQKELNEAKSHEASYRTLDPDKAHALMRTDLTRISTDLESKTPALLQSNLAPKGLTKQLVQQSLTYFASTQSAAGDDPSTLAALGRAYLAVAQTQWSPDHASLNEPDAAVSTCKAALNSLTAKTALSNNPEIKQIVGQITNQLEQNPAAHQL